MFILRPKAPERGSERARRHIRSDSVHVYAREHAQQETATRVCVSLEDMCVSVTRRRDLLVVFWRTHNGDGLGQHELVGAVCVEVHAGQERRLGGVGLEPGRETII